jgi:hypothetical protein
MMGRDGARAMGMPTTLVAASTSTPTPTTAMTTTTAEGDYAGRGIRGMPVPSKKLGGLSNKIRSVSKIMVRERASDEDPKKYEKHT